MPAKTNFNQPPYYDDFADDKKYYRILFRPSRAVQARELTQIQSMLQAQIERFGNNIFLPGANVYPGTKECFKYTSNIAFIKLPATSSQNTGTDQEIETNWLNKRVTNQLGVEATVIGYRSPDNINGGETRLFLEYKKAANTRLTFENGDIISTIVDVGTPNTLTIPTPTDPDQLKTGFISAVKLDGYNIFYYNGFFVFVEKQTLYLVPGTPSDPDPDSLTNQKNWTNNPTTLVALKFTEEIKTYQDKGHENLTDNATGSSNFAAPGADRLYIDATLFQTFRLDPNSADTLPPSSVLLGEIVNGEITYLTPYTNQYDVIADTMARRTYDESGDYVVEPFIVHVKEFLADPDKKIDGAHEIKEFQWYNNPVGAEDQAEKLFGLVKVGTEATSVEYPPGSKMYYPGKSYDGGKDSFKELCSRFVSVRLDPGKAYVKGYEITKLGRETVDVPKSRTKKFFNNQTIQAGLGAYIGLTDLFGCPNFSSFSTAKLYRERANEKNIGNPPTIGPNNTTQATPIGTLKVVEITNVDSDDVRLYFTDVNLNDDMSFDDVRSLWIPGTGTGTTAVSANIKISEYPLSGSATRINPETNAPIIDKQYLFGIGTEWKNNPQEVLKKGDYIRLGSDDDTFWKVANNPEGDTKIEIEPAYKSINGVDDTVDVSEGTVDQNGDWSTPYPNMWKNNSKIYVASVDVKSDSLVDGLLYPLPTNFISDVKTATQTGEVSSDNDTIYTIPVDITKSDLTGISPGSSGVYTVTLNPSIAKSFAPVSSNGYKVVSVTGTWMKIAAGTSTPNTAGVVNVQITSTAGTQQAVFRFHNNDKNSRYRIIVAYEKSNTTAIPRTKVLKKGSFNSTTGVYEHTGGLTKGYFVAPYNSNTYIELPECDIYRITRITTSPGSNAQPSNLRDTLDNGQDNPAWVSTGDKRIDVLYSFNNGQTDYYYGYGSLTLKPEYAYNRPAGQIRVEFDYFDHQNPDRDYFSVETYTDAGLNYEDIPLYYPYNSEDPFSLADCLDFRRKLSEFSEGTISQKGIGPIDRILCDYFCYVPRWDRLVLDVDRTNKANKNFGKFKLIQGKPSLTPNLPDEPVTSMTVCEVQNDPYGFNNKSCRIKMIDNLRYTMKDIGRLEKRIKNLEYYTSLSLLESETSSLIIKDANGSDRFKNGFLVDNFASDSSSSRENTDYAVTLDMETAEAMPLKFTDKISLAEEISYPVGTETEQIKQDRRFQKNYTKIGTEDVGFLYTLPYTTKTFISQPYASKVSNINPFNIVKYRGVLLINPWTDEWVDNVVTDLGNVIDDTDYQNAKKNFKGGTRTEEPIIKTTGRSKWSSWHYVTDKWDEKKDTYTNPLKMKVLVAGGRFYRTDKAAYKRAKASGGKYKVPKGFYNEGEYVPIQTDGHHHSFFQEIQERTRTVTKKVIRHSATATIVDKGLSDPVRQIIDQNLKEILYMRSREVKFSGECFSPGVKLFAFFDDVDITNYCRLNKTGPAGWDTFTVKITGNNSDKQKFTFVLDNNGQFPSTVRAGCEVIIYNTTTNLPTRKFDIVSVATDSKSILVDEKSIIGQPDPDSTIEFPSTSATFTGTLTNNGSAGQINVTASAPQASNLYIGQTITGLNIPTGSVIVGFSPATGAVSTITINNKITSGVGTSVNLTVPVKAAFQVSISKFAYGDPIVADDTGAVSGYFRIPNEEGKRIKCGDVIFRLTTSSVNAPSAPSSAIARYTARGWRNEIVTKTTQTRLFDITDVGQTTEEEITETETDTKTRVIDVDPIAQTFTVEEDGGCCITSVDIYFKRKPGSEGPSKDLFPAILDLRETDEDTTPTSRIVGGITLGTVVVKAEDVVVNQPIVNNNFQITGIKIVGTAGALKDSDGKYFWGETQDSNGNTIKSDILADSQWVINPNTNLPIRSEKIYSNSILSPVSNINKDQDMNSMTYDMVPTRFKFPVPLKLDKGKQYAIVLRSLSDEYEVWVSQKGEIKPPPLSDTSGNTGTGDPNSLWQNTSMIENYVIGSRTKTISSLGTYTAGDFWSSKNGTGWLIDPSMAFKFNVNKAVFNNAREGEITLVNTEIAWTKIMFDGLEVIKDSGKIRVPFANHGVIVGDKILLNIDNDLTDADLKGYKVVHLEEPSGHKVISTDTDSFVIQVTGSVDENGNPTNTIGTTATETGKIGGANTLIQVNKRFEELILSANTFTIPNLTDIDFTIITTTTKGVNDPTVIEVNKRIVPETLEPGQRISFLDPRRINIPIMEPTGSAGQTLNISDKRSVVIKAILRSSNPNLSPILDTAMLSCALIGTRLNNPAGIPESTGKKGVINVDVLDDVTILAKGTYNTSPTAKTVCFTPSSGILAGTFNQDDLSTTVKRAGSGNTGLPALTTLLNPGDTITDPDTGQVRIVRRVYADEVEINVPFNPGFPSGTPKRLETNKPYMIIKTSSSTVANALSALDVGKYASLNVYGGNSTISFTNKLVLEVDPTPNAIVNDPDLDGPCFCKITIQHYNETNNVLNVYETKQFEIIQKNKFVDEIAPLGGSAVARYICKALTLDNSSTAFRVTFDGLRDDTCEFHLYYRTEAENSEKSIFDTNWTKAEFNIDENGFLVVKQPKPDSAAFLTYEATVDKLKPFKCIQAKIVILGGNPSDSAKLKNFTLMAFAD